MAVTSGWEKYTLPLPMGGINTGNSSLVYGVQDIRNFNCEAYGLSKRNGYSSLADNYYIDYKICSLCQYNGAFVFTGNNSISYTFNENSLMYNGSYEIKSQLDDDYFSFATANTRLYISSLNHFFWVDTDWHIYDVGITAPSAITVSNMASGSLVAGTYLVGYTYMRSGIYGFESNPKISSTTLVSSSLKIDITVTASTDPQVDRIAIYVSGAGGSVYYYQTDVSNVNQIVTISSVVLGTRTLSFDNDVPPKAKFIKYCGDRMFYCSLHGARSKISWSNPGNPHGYNTDNVASFSNDDGEEITGVAQLVGSLVVFKNTKTFLLDILADNPTQTMISQKLGCFSQNSIQEIIEENAVIFMTSEYEIMMFSYSGEINFLSISKNEKFEIHNLIKDNIDNTGSIVSGYDRVNREYIIIIPTRNGGSLWMTYRFGYGWSISDRKGATSMCSALGVNSDPVIVFAIGTITSNIYQAGGSSDNGSQIKSYFKTHGINLGLPQIKKTVRRIFLNVNGIPPNELQQVDKSIWGYIFVSTTNDLIFKNPFSVGEASASSSTVGYGPELAFDGNKETYWRSDGVNSGILSFSTEISVRSFLIGYDGRYNSMLSFNTAATQTHYIQWDWGIEVVILGFKVNSLIATIHEFSVETSLDGILWENFCNGSFLGTNDIYVCTDESERVARIFRLTTKSLYGSYAAIKSISVIVSSKADRVSYILSKTPGKKIYIVSTPGIEYTNSIIDKFKDGVLGWGLNYYIGSVDVEIADTLIIEGALGSITFPPIGGSVIPNNGLIDVIITAISQSLSISKSELLTSSFFVGDYLKVLGSTPGIFYILPDDNILGKIKITSDLSLAGQSSDFSIPLSEIKSRLVPSSEEIKKKIEIHVRGESFVITLEASTLNWGFRINSLDFYYTTGNTVGSGE